MENKSSLQPDPDEVLERLNETLQKEIDDLDFPCAICSVSFGQHDISMLKKCFQSIPNSESSISTVGEWRPIESAPKGCVSVLLGSMECTEIEMGYADFKGKDALCTEGHMPTHYQPLPTPPCKRER